MEPTPFAGPSAGNTEPVSAASGRPAELTHEQLEYFMRRGRRMRAEAFHQLMIELGAFLFDLIARRGDRAGTARLACRDRAPLTGQDGRLSA